MTPQSLTDEARVRQWLAGQLRADEVANLEAALADDALLSHLATAMEGDESLLQALRQRSSQQVRTPSSADRFVERLIERLQQPRAGLSSLGDTQSIREGRQSSAYAFPSPQHAAVAARPLPTAIDGYQIVAILGQGGMG